MYLILIEMAFKNKIKREGCIEETRSYREEWRLETGKHVEHERTVREKEKKQ